MLIVILFVVHRGTEVLRGCRTTGAVLALIDGCLVDVVACTLEESCQAHAGDNSTYEN